MVTCIRLCHFFKISHPWFAISEESFLSPLLKLTHDAVTQLDFVNIQLGVYEVGSCQVMKVDRLQPRQSWDNLCHQILCKAKIHFMSLLSFNKSSTNQLPENGHKWTYVRGISLNHCCSSLVQCSILYACSGEVKIFFCNHNTNVLCVW